MRRSFQVLLTVMMVLISGHLAFGADEDTASVTYVAGSTIYIDAGVDDGLRVGDRVEVIREGNVVAVLAVTYISGTRSACAVMEKSDAISAGEVVRYTVTDERNGPATPAGTGNEHARSSTSRKRGGRSGFGIRGRVGIRYLLVMENYEESSDYSQPAFDVRLDGRRLGGTPWGLEIDVRSRRTSRTFNDGRTEADSLTRVYRMAVTGYMERIPFAFKLGRHYSPALASVSIFDGFSGQYDMKKFSLGLFSGTQPDPSGFGYSSEIREHGLYAQFRGSRSSRHRWLLTTGIVGSYDSSEVNREFLYVQGRYSNPRLSVYLTEEVDYNRGWKADAGESTISPTSTFISLNFRVNDSLRLNGGFDNRRNVRLYRDSVTPETEFDDSYRQGAWLGTSLTFKQHYRIGLNARVNDGGVAGDSEAYTLVAGANGLTSLGLGFHTRTTMYSSGRVEGWLYSAGAGVRLGKAVYLELSGGIRDEEDILSNDFRVYRTVSWYGLDLDFTLGRRWYAQLSGEWSQGDMEDVEQFYGGLSYRF